MMASCAPFTFDNPKDPFVAMDVRPMSDAEINTRSKYDAVPLELEEEVDDIEKQLIPKGSSSRKKRNPCVIV